MNPEELTKYMSNLCRDSLQAPRVDQKGGRPVSVLKIFLEYSDSTRRSEVTRATPMSSTNAEDNLMAQSLEMARTLGCVTESELILETCYYSYKPEFASKESASKYYRKRWESTVMLINLETKEKFAQTTLQGTIPRQCPPKISSGETGSFGKPVITDAIREWISQNVDASE